MPYRKGYRRYRPKSFSRKPAGGGKKVKKLRKMTGGKPVTWVDLS